jgi:hypothetical protein
VLDPPGATSLPDDPEPAADGAGGLGVVVVVVVTGAAVRVTVGVVTTTEGVTVRVTVGTPPRPDVGDEPAVPNRLVPAPASPRTMALTGRPAISSTPVTSASTTAKTATAPPARCANVIRPLLLGFLCAVVASERSVARVSRENT